MVQLLVLEGPGRLRRSSGGSGVGPLGNDVIQSGTGVDSSQDDGREEKSEETTEEMKRGERERRW